MSITFTETLQLIDRNCKTDENSYPIEEKTADINLALDKVFSIIFQSSGRWQFDDSNHEKYPFITTGIIQGQRDYSFVTDEQGNLILDIYKAMVKNADGYYEEVYPVDQQSDEAMDSFFDGKETQGRPYRYDKTANGIFLDPVPEETIEAGLKVFINREGSHFTTSDTNKMAGFAGLFHEYLALRPSYQYAYRNGLSNTNKLQEEMLIMEKDIKKYYRDRSRDEVARVTPQTINSI